MHMLYISIILTASGLTFFHQKHARCMTSNRIFDNNPDSIEQFMNDFEELRRHVVPREIKQDTDDYVSDDDQEETMPNRINQVQTGLPELNAEGGLIFQKLPRNIQQVLADYDERCRNLHELNKDDIPAGVKDEMRNLVEKVGLEYKY
jgi:hypothetical protein